MNHKSLKPKTVRASSKDRENYKTLGDLLKNCPIPEDELIGNLGLFINRQSLSRILFMHELYQKIIDVHGIVIEFGVRWGQNLALFESFRGMYEPFNHNRKIVGFDTFEGFPSVHEKDGRSELLFKGSHSVSAGYEKYLEALLHYHEQESPISHLKKFELIKGDACVEFEKYLADNPQTIIALVYFDFDLYEPTRQCLQLMKNHITKGTVIGFDELNLPEFPGETLALKEVLGLDMYQIRRSPNSSGVSYIVI
ncbi:MAG: TylF/MycF/NovP-related O-methyltransferase [Desulfobacula sp.]|jgi:hypothetical protein